MKGFNIQNSEPRKVRCIDVPDDSLASFFPNKDLLVLGKEYNFEKMIVRNWRTEVFLQEFPDIPFNSVQFAELD